MYSKLSNLIITKIDTVITSYNEPCSKIIRKNRNFWAIIIKSEGETVYFNNGRSYISNINNIVILPKGSNYEWQCTKAGHYSVIQFDGNFEEDTIYSFSIKNGEKFLGIIKSLEYKRLSNQPFNEMECIRDTYAILLSLLAQSKDSYMPQYNEKKLQPAIEYISKNYTKEIKNDYLAELTGFSTVYFRKLFTEVYGVSPISYIKAIKIKNAKEMLNGDFSSITDIAFSLGYSSIYDFSRDFKKQTGISPLKYAKTME